jgi:hypothetical protein
MAPDYNINIDGILAEGGLKNNNLLSFPCLTITKTVLLKSLFVEDKRQ